MTKTRLTADIKIVLAPHFDPKGFRLDSAKRAAFLAKKPRTVGEFTKWCKKIDPKRDGRGFLYALIARDLIAV